MEYTIISESSQQRLIEAVNNKIKQGFKPQGGVMVYNTIKEASSISRNLSLEYSQAMVKHNLIIEG